MSGLAQGNCELATCLMTKRMSSLWKFWRMWAGRSLIPGYTFDPFNILGRMKVGSGASSNWNAGHQLRDKGGERDDVHSMGLELTGGSSMTSSLKSVPMCCGPGFGDPELRIWGRLCHMVTPSWFASRRRVPWHRNGPSTTTQTD